MDQAQLFWKQFRQETKEKLRPEVFDFFIEEAQLHSLDNNLITISLSNKAKQSFWEKNIEDFILTTSFNLFKRPIQIAYHFTDSPVKGLYKTEEKKTIFPQQEETQQTSIQPFSFPSELFPDYTFDNFVQGESNRLAYAAAEAAAEEPGKLYNPVFIYGGPGLGKTHLLKAIGNYIQKNNPSARVKYVSTETFTNELIKALHLDKSMQAAAMDEFKQRYRQVDVLLIDDVQSLRNKPTVQEEFFNTFEALSSKKKQIVLTSDRTPKTLDNLEQRIISRFSWGTIAEISPPDFDMRVDILRNKCLASPYHFPNETLSYLAGQFDSHVRDLEGALKDITLLAKVEKQTEITVEVAARALRSRLQQQAGKKVISIESIQQETGKYYGVSPAEIKGNKRVKHIAHARQVAMYLARELTDNSLPKIGREFGNRDHTTVMHAHNKIKMALTDDSTLDIDLTAIKNNII